MFHKIWLMVMGFALSSMASQVSIRFPAVSGQFYPASSGKLKRDIEAYLSTIDQNSPRVPSKIIGMIAPHAGYKYSGQTAAHAYHILKKHPVDVIVILGPYHADQFPGVSIWPEGIWRTPLGETPIDENLARNIQKESPAFLYDRQIHLSEHSLEVQLPFIQAVAKNAKIVPVLISDIKYAKALANALYKHLDGRSTLVIASTDLSHYHPDATARDIDQKTQDIFQALSPGAFRKAYQEGKIELCGAAAVLTLLELSHLYGQAEFTNLHYANSGDQIHDKTSVVGYNASLIALSDTLSFEQGQILLGFARDALFACLTHQTIPTFMVEDPTLKQNRAVFVTLRDKAGNLRGCIGRFEPEEPLYQAVQHMSIEAATKDNRFSPVSLNELPNLSIEISVLDMPVEVKSAHDILYGTHGVTISRGGHRGVFLPEVSHDFATKEEFLSELCFQKAGLPRNCWKNPQTQIKVFTTQKVVDKK